MRVLHLVGASEDNGGILSVIRNVAQATNSWGWTHTTWVRNEYREVRAPELEYARTRFLWSEHPSHLQLFWGAALAFRELRTWLKLNSFDVIHAHSRGGFVVAALLALISRQTVVFTNHAYARRVGMYRAATRLRHFYTTVLTPSMARHYGLEVAPPKVTVVSECCADSWFENPMECADQNVEPRTTVRFVGLGNLLPWKKWELLLEALALLPSSQQRRAEVLVWGPTPNLEEARKFEDSIRCRVGDLGLEASFKLMGPTNEVLKALRCADWFVLPSTHEPCSVALIEALAMGVPALVSKSGGNVDIIREGVNGFLFDPDNAADLSKQMSRVINSSATVASKALIRESVRSRSGTEVARQLGALYTSVRGRSCRAIGLP